MVFAKTNKLTDILLFGYLIFFPFGQLLRLDLSFLSQRITLMPTDLLILVIGIVNIKLITKNSTYLALLSVIGFSFVVNIFTYNFTYISGIFYFLRLFSYLGLWLVLADVVKQQNTSDLLAKSILAVLFFVGVFGWIQYFFFPDLRGLFAYGWDDHLNRLTGTFLDPGFTGILLVFGTLASLISYVNLKNKNYLLLAIFFTINMFFTYSRASYLALLIALIYILVKAKKLLWVMALILLTLAVYFVLPNKEGEGTNLLRTKSITLRLQNYASTLSVVKENPLFGVGYNNLCVYKVERGIEINSISHACSGSDNVFLFVLATTGVVGFIMVSYFTYWLITGTADNYQGTIFIASLVALLVHAQFTNSFFYPWVLGVLAILFAVSRENG